MKKSKQQSARIRNLVVALTLTTIMLSVSTFAWFIGMRTVGITSFDIEIAATEDLELSLNGKDWDETVIINGENYNDEETVYEGNTNWWAGGGLIPMSSIGEIDIDSSRLKLYEKASLTASYGGYRLMASRIANGIEGDAEEREHPEVPGYVAFDLFVRNSTGSQYIVDYNEDDEEAIYLATNSEVTVAESGGGVPGTGIENSVRVAFAQIGRVHGKDSASEEIVNITCKGEGGVTSICERPASIWEPNDTSHVTGAISYYQTSCLTRNEDGEFSEDEKCALIEEGEYYPTFAVAKPIGSEHKVDVYDGTIYNGYGGKTLLPEPDLYNGFPSDFALEDEEDALLYAVPTFTDTMKMQRGTARRPFMYLAPNSVTKIRVYIYIEGQDIDNYDFASIGKRISVNFGFTKQRYEAEDIPGYETHPAGQTETP